VDNENIRNRGFNTAVNNITSILDTSKMGYQHIENFKNARECIIREYEDTDSNNLPDERYQIRLVYYDDEQIRDALRAVPGIDADTIVDRLDDHEVTQAYERDRAEARTAAGTAAESQGKTSTSDGPVRFTAPSLVFERDGHRLIAGGWQPILAYDVLVANLDPAIRRTPPPETPEPLLKRFPDGLTTAEVAALLAQGPDYRADPEAAEQALLPLVAGGEAVRVPLGQDALWRVAHVAEASVREKSTAAVP